MLKLLVDANLSPELPRQMRRLHPDIPIVHIATWEEGRYRHRADYEVLSRAYSEHYTLVTADVGSIAVLLQELAERGQSHGGVIFVPQRLASKASLGSLVRCLSALWPSQGDRDWTDAASFLSPQQPEAPGASAVPE